MSETMNYILIENFKCKRCGYNKYDELIYTGDKLINEKDSIIQTRYVCRNCDFPFNINDYTKSDSININKHELLNNTTTTNKN